MAKKDGGAVNSKKRLTKDELLKALAVRTEEFELPEGAGTITLQSVPLRHIQHVQGVGEDTSEAEAIKRICLMGIREPELSLEDLDRLDDGQAGTISQISNAVMRLSGLGGKEPEAFLTGTPESKDSSTTASKSSDGSPASST